MVKVLYLLAGISLKQTIDEAKAVWQRHIDRLIANRDSLKEYRPNPAIMAGSREDFEMQGRWRHQAIVAPDVAKMTKRINRLQWLPLICYSLFTVALVAGIMYIESLTP